MIQRSFITNRARDASTFGDQFARNTDLDRVLDDQPRQPIIIIPSDEVLEAERSRPLHEHLMIMLALGTAGYFLGHFIVWLVKPLLLGA